MAQFYDASKSSTPSSLQTTPPSSYRSPQAQASPAVENFLQADSTTNQSPLTSGKHNDYDGGDPTPNRKSSVLNKFREKAKKLKSTLSSRRIRQSNTDRDYEHETGNEIEIDSFTDEPDDRTIRSLNLNLDEGEVDDDPEYLGAPIYESVQAPEECKENVKQHPREVTASAEKHIIESCVKSKDRKDGQEPTRKTMIKQVSEKLLPAYNAVSNATHAITSKISSLGVETPGSAEKIGNNSPEDASSESRGQMRNTSPHTYDKGVSVKEYLMQKLEPGEDEKALSQVITDAISPKGSEQVGMVGKMKEAVTSFLQPSSDSATKAAVSSGETNVSTDQKSSSNKSFTASRTFTTMPYPAYMPSTQKPNSADPKSYSLSKSSNDNNTMKSKSCNATSNLKLSAFIPISTTSEEGTKTESHGRILQSN